MFSYHHVYCPADFVMWRSTAQSETAEVNLAVFLLFLLYTVSTKQSQMIFSIILFMIDEIL